jgi:hypothetical protein
LLKALGNLLVVELLGSSGSSGSSGEVLGSTTELGFYRFHLFVTAIHIAAERSAVQLKNYPLTPGGKSAIVSSKED